MLVMILNFLQLSHWVLLGPVHELRHSEWHGRHSLLTGSLEEIKHEYYGRIEGGDVCIRVLLGPEHELRHSEWHGRHSLLTGSLEEIKLYSQCELMRVK